MTDSSESLFFEDETGGTGAGSASNQFMDQLPESIQESPRSPHSIGKGPRYESFIKGGDEERYNENEGAAIKRRKVGDTWTEKGSGSPASQQSGRDHPLHRGEGSESTVVSSSIAKGSRIGRNGPFIDESDSRADSETNVKILNRADNEMNAETSKKVLK